MRRIAAVLLAAGLLAGCAARPVAPPLVNAPTPGAGQTTGPTAPPAIPFDGSAAGEEDAE